MKTEVGFQPRQENSGTKVPPPKEHNIEVVKNGSGVLTPQKEAVLKQEAGLKSHFQEKCKSEVLSDTKVSLPDISGTKVPPPNEKSTGLKHRLRHLPHIDLVGHYQFVTFRTYDSVDEFLRKCCFSLAMSNKEKQQKIDEYLDTSANGAYLKGEVLEWLFEFLLSQDKKLYELVAFAIMNNHVHILFKPLESLSKVMQMIKGASAKKINELLGKSGNFWADDYYDKAIRDEKHFWMVYEYIKNNPLKIDNRGTEVPLPKSGAKAPLPRFYGVYE